MNDDRKAVIAKLAGDAHDKRMRHEMLSMMNVPSDPDKRRQQSIDYAIAEAEMMEAQHRLDRAKQPVQPPLGWTGNKGENLGTQPERQPAT